MSSVEKIKKLFAKSDITVNSKVDDRIINDALTAFDESQRIKSLSVEPEIWRIIMNRKITKLAAAVVIILVIILAKSLWNKSTPTAYAIEQTVEAMRKISTIHILGTTWDGGQLDIWETVDPETGKYDHSYIDSPYSTTVATPNEEYIYDKQTNKVTHLVGGNNIHSDVRFGRFIEDMFDVAKSLDTEIKIDFVYDPDRAKEVILLVLEHESHTLESKIDPETKLPLSMVMKASAQPQPGHYGRSFDEIYYDLPLPEGIFEFEIPDGAEVIEKQYQ
jgi:outer membrane lipoprotein-sorting protein